MFSLSIATPPIGEMTPIGPGVVIVLRHRHHNYRVQTLYATPSELIADAPARSQATQCAVGADDVTDPFRAKIRVGVRRPTKHQGTMQETERPLGPPKCQPTQARISALASITALLPVRPSVTEIGFPGGSENRSVNCQLHQLNEIDERIRGRFITHKNW
jgi:hypothetical protein